MCNEFPFRKGRLQSPASRLSGQAVQTLGSVRAGSACAAAEGLSGDSAGSPRHPLYKIPIFSSLCPSTSFRKGGPWSLYS